MAPFRRIQAHAGDPVTERGGRLQHLQRLPFGQVAPETHDQFRRDAEHLSGIDTGLLDTLHEGLERDPAGSVSLRVEEDLRVAHAVAMGALEIGPGQVVEILLAAQHLHALEKEIQKLLQATEAIGGARLLHRAEAQAHAIALGQREHHLRLKTALDMHVQFCLGKAVDKWPHFIHVRSSGPRGTAAVGATSVPSCRTNRKGYGAVPGLALDKTPQPCTMCRKTRIHYSTVTSR